MYLTKAELETVIAKVYKAKKVTIQERLEDDTSSWTGMPWDDGPLPQQLAGIEFTIEQ